MRWGEPVLRRMTAVLAFALALAGAVPAAADTAADAAEADGLFRDAGQAYDAGDFARARSLYERAFEKKKTHDIAAMLAQTEMKLGRPCEADAHLAYAVAQFPPSFNDERRARIEKARAAVKKQIGALRLDPALQGVTVQVDHRTVPASSLPGPFCVAAGERVVFVSRDGFAVEREVLTVDAGAVVTVTATLRPLGPTGPRAGERTPGPAVSGGPPPPTSLVTPLAAGGLFAGVGAILVGSALLSYSAARTGAADEELAKLKQMGGESACAHGGDHADTCRRLGILRASSVDIANVGLTSVIGGATISAVAIGLLLFRPPIAGSRPGGPRVTVGAAPDGAFIAFKGAF